MSRKTTTWLSTLAVLAAASAPGRAAHGSAAAALETATRAAAPLSPCAATADDLVGDVALRLWSRRRDVLDGPNARAYIEASVRNAWRDHLRRRRATLFSDLPDGESRSAPDAAAPSADDVESLTTAAEFRASLLPFDREVLSHLEAGETDRDIARLLQRTRHSVRAAVQRIRRHARRHFPDTAPSDT